VTDSDGVSVFRINGKVRFARTFVIESHQGASPLTVREKLLALAPTYLVTRQGNQVAMVCRTTTSGAAVDRFTIDLGSDGPLEASGKLYTSRGVAVTRGGSVIARIWRNQAALRETLELDTTSTLDQAVLLAVAMSIAETDSSRGQTPPDALP
jgi:uncharacterized protein YxjI